MKRSLMIGTLVLAAAGCVPEEKYRAAKMEAENYQGQLNSAQTATTAAQQKADALQRQLDAMNANSGNAVGLVNNLQQQLAAKQADLDEANRRYAEAMAKVGSMSVLPAPLTSELSNLASQNPDLVEFDQGRGTVKFKSDLTFDVGQTTVKPDAKTVLQKFATILNSQAAAPYELLIAGHTDSQPVSNAATIKAGNLDNWYLSAHRAIAVKSVLTGEHVNPQRIGVVGYADQHPVASNGTEPGRAANRRVEVLILPTQVSTTQPSESPAPTAPPAPAARASRKKTPANEGKEGGPVAPPPSETK